MDSQSHVPMSLVLGHGRSGTTWLGSMLNTHPDIAYRFEPFHRLQKSNPRALNFFEVLQSREANSDDLWKVYEDFIVADPLTLKPPFFEKNFSNQKSIKEVWMISRAFRPAKFIYSALYTPKEKPSLVIKDVCYEQHIHNILAKSSIPLVYLVRHPCGNILSNLKGQETNKMTQKRNEYLAGFMQYHAPCLYEKHGQRIGSMDTLEKIAWFWRISLDLGVKAILDVGRGKLLTYEQLCNDPKTYVKEIFEYFSLNYPQETDDFIESLYFEDQGQNSLRSKDLMDKYFSVYRNPQSQKSSWKAKITKEQRQVIEAVVHDSPGFEYCASLGHWD